MKIHRKTQRGMGKLKFCMNMYHTKNKIMVNGPDSSLFNKNHDQIVKVILEKIGCTGAEPSSLSSYYDSTEQYEYYESKTQK